MEGQTPRRRNPTPRKWKHEGTFSRETLQHPDFSKMTFTELVHLDNQIRSRNNGNGSHAPEPNNSGSIIEVNRNGSGQEVAGEPLLEPCQRPEIPT